MKTIHSLVISLALFVSALFFISCDALLFDTPKIVTAEQLEGMWLTTHRNAEAIETEDASVLSFESDGAYIYAIGENDFSQLGPFDIVFEGPYLILKTANQRYDYYAELVTPESLSLQLIKEEENGAIQFHTPGEIMHYTKVESIEDSQLFGMWYDTHTLADGSSHNSILQIKQDGTMYFDFNSGQDKLLVNYKVYGNLMLQIAGEQKFGLVIDDVSRANGQITIHYHSQYPDGIILYGSCVKWGEETSAFDAADLYGGYWIGYAVNGEELSPEQCFVAKYNPDGTELYAEWDPTTNVWKEQTYSYDFQQDRIVYSQDLWQGTSMLSYLNHKLMIDSYNQQTFTNRKTSVDYQSSILGVWFEEDESSYYEFQENNKVYTNTLEEGVWVRYEEKYHLYGDLLVWEFEDEETGDPVYEAYFIEVSNGILLFDARGARTDIAVRGAIL